MDIWLLLLFYILSTFNSLLISQTTFHYMHLNYNLHVVYSWWSRKDLLLETILVNVTLQYRTCIVKYVTEEITVAK